MVHITYPVLNQIDLDKLKQELEERHQRVQWGVNNIWDFDSLVQDQNGSELVRKIYFHEINRFRNSQQDINYMIFFNRGTSPETGAIMLSSSLCERTGLQYAITFLNRQSLTVDRVKWGRLGGSTRYLDGGGILLTERLSDSKPIISASEKVCERGEKIKLVIAYSTSICLEQTLGEDLSKKGIELRVLFQDKK